VVTPFLPLALLPAGTLALAVYALRPRDQVLAPLRLAVARAAVVLGGYGVVSVEVLSAFDLLTTGGVIAVWVLALAVVGTAAWLRRHRTAPGGGQAGPLLSERWYALSRAERILALAVVGLVVAELVLALASPPNTYDSQTYHLPKIEHWAAQHDVDFYPVRIHRQVTYAPGAEYLLLHLRLLTGVDTLYALLQWSAGVVAILLATRLTAQLGGSRRAQLLAAFVLAAAPAVVLESSSTQTDLVVAAWVACLATLVLDGVRGAPIRQTVLLFGVATGLIALTKQTGLFAAAPLLLWWGLARISRADRRVRTTAGVVGSAAVVLGLTAAIAGPFVWRVYTEFGHPLGPDYLRNSITMQRHDPAALLVNGVRLGQSVLDTPIPGLSDWSAAGVRALGRAVGVDASDPAITFDHTTFPETVWYPSEDKAAYPVQALLMIAGTLAALAGRGRPRAYAAVILVALVLHTALVKWQPWGNRLFLYLAVLAAPLAGLLVDEVLARESVPARRRRAVLAGAMAAVLALGGVAGGLSALYGWPRRLVGNQSVFVLDDWRGRFVTRPSWADDYTAVAAVVRASGARRIGIIQQNDSWEYPWWLLFRGRELVAVQSMLRHRPPASTPDLDAMVCAGPEAACREWVPSGWHMRMHGEVGWLLPPERAPAPGP
jgi:hypothetical protein